MKLSSRVTKREIHLPFVVKQAGSFVIGFLPSNISIQGFFLRGALL
jgi:hypothetical protein